MHWGVGPERFLLGKRQWIRRSQFQPMDRIQDAFRVLRKAATGYLLAKTPDGVFTATVQVGDRAGEASGRAEAATISLAIARAIGVDLKDGQ
jgi:hypothetical protein